MTHRCRVLQICRIIYKYKYEEKQTLQYLLMTQKHVTKWKNMQQKQRTYPLILQEMYLFFPCFPGILGVRELFPIATLDVQSYPNTAYIWSRKHVSSIEKYSF